MRDLSLKKMTTIAVREFRSTALTKAFLFGAVIFPMVIWGMMAAVGGMNFKKPKLEGTFAVVDTTKDQAVLSSVQRAFDPKVAEEKAAAERAALEEAIKAQKEKLPPGVTDQQLQSAQKMASAMTGFGEAAVVTVEALPPDVDMQAQRQRATRNDVLAVARITEDSLTTPVVKTGEKVSADSVIGTYEFIQGAKLRPDHADKLRSVVNDAIQDERFRRVGIDPDAVRTVQMARPVAKTVVATESGDKKDNEVMTRLLPFIFMFLIYMAVMTGGQYLLMGTLEEKSSRVMEVILSAASPQEILIGKLIGQGLVGLAVMGIYASVGLAVAKNFGAFGSVPLHILPWAVLYFLMAYAFLGSMMLAVGSAVTEIREAQALYTPITIMFILPFLLMVPVSNNPGSLVSKAFSYFPPTTPYVMVMRMSQTSNPIPLWELIATTVVGFIGVGIVVWCAAKIFRVGVLMYGKPPSLMGLLKWIRYA